MFTPLLKWKLNKQANKTRTKINQANKTSKQSKENNQTDEWNKVIMKTDIWNKQKNKAIKKLNETSNQSI